MTGTRRSPLHPATTAFRKSSTGAPRFPDSEDLAALAAAHRLDITGGSLDLLPDLSICPETARGFPGHPGLIARHADGTPLAPCFTFARADATETTLALRYRDAANGLTYTARITADPAPDCSPWRPRSKPTARSVSTGSRPRSSPPRSFPT